MGCKDGKALEMVQALPCERLLFRVPLLESLECFRIPTMHSDSIVTTPAVESTSVAYNLTEAMKFNDGHRMSIVTYSVLMVVSAVGNLTVLITILKRRRSLRFGNNFMFMHLAIADLLVSAAVATAFRKLQSTFGLQRVIAS
jgi:hypothetical protein